MPPDDKDEEARRRASQMFLQFLGVEPVTKPADCLSVIRNGRGITVVRDGNVLRVVSRVRE